jgi:nitrite reductase/ring-hydroxylating ferredoxin subunit
MQERFICKASELKDGDRQIIRIGEKEIGIFRHEGEYFAYSNFCPHQGGPACEGLTIARVEECLREDKTSMGLSVSETQMNFVCPWHGYEFDMRTGEHVADRSIRLRKYNVVEKGDEIYVVV